MCTLEQVVPWGRSFGESHYYKTDGRGLDSERSRELLEYVRRLWRRPVVLHAIDHDGAPHEMAA